MPVHIHDVHPTHWDEAMQEPRENMLTDTFAKAIRVEEEELSALGLIPPAVGWQSTKRATHGTKQKSDVSLNTSSQKHIHT